MILLELVLIYINTRTFEFSYVAGIFFVRGHAFFVQIYINSVWGYCFEIPCFMAFTIISMPRVEVMTTIEDY